MNKELEQKIVEMKFDNSDFEQKVAQSLVTLGKLKESTKLEDAGKGLDNLSKSAKNLDLSHIADGIDKLNARFSNLGIVGMTVMQNLTNAAMNLGNQFMNALTEAPRGGMQTYESFISATKQLKNSAKDANGLPVTLEAVNKALDELNTYSDKTIYSFNDMTANIGKFTNAGVSLEDSVTAIKGISNVAASAGASAQNAAAAMYNFGQALGSGVVRRIDWRSIVNANMSTQEFKEQLIQTAEELGTLRKEGDKWISTTYTGKKATEEAFNANEKFEDSLQQQWMTSEVLIKTLGKYANEMDPIGAKAYQAATEVNTFSQMLSVFAESQKTSWSKTWRYIFGDYEESKQLFTNILGGLNWMTDGFNKWRNDFFKTWHDLGGRDNLISAFGNIWETVKHYVEEIGGALGMVFGNIDATPLVTVAKGFNAITEKIKPVADGVNDVTKKVKDTAEAVSDVAERAEKFNEIVQQIINGDWGSGQERIDRLHEAGYAFENLQNAVNEVLGCEKRYETVVSDNEAVGLSANEVLSENAELLTDQAEGVEAVTDEVKKQNPVIGNLAKIVLGVSSTVKVLKTGLSAVWNTLAKGASVLTVVKNALGFILDIFGTIGGKVYAFNTWLLSFSNIYGLLNGFRMKLNEMTGGLKDAGLSFESITTLLTKMGKGLSYAEGEVKKFFTNLVNGAKSFDFDKLKNVIFTIGKFVGGVLLVALNGLADIIIRVYNGAKDLKDTIANMEIVGKIVNHIKNLKEEFKGFVTSVKDANYYTDVLLPIIAEVSKTMQRLGSAVLPIVSDAFQQVKTWIVQAGDKLEKFYQSLKDSGALEKVSTTFTNFKEAIKSIPETITALYEAFKAGKMPTIGDLPEAFQKFVNSFKDLKEFVKTKIDQKIQNWFTGITDMLGNLPDSKKLGPFAGFVEKLKKAFEDFKTTAELGKGSVALFLSGVIDKLSKVDFRGGAITALIGALGIFVFRWSKVGKSSAKAIKALGDFIKNGGKVAQTAVDKYNGFLKIAAAIGIIAGSIWLLAQVPADRFREVCIALGVAFVAMAGTILLLSTLKIPEDKIKAIGIAFGGMGAGFLAVAVAAKIIGNMDENELKKGGGALVAFVILVVAAAKLAGKVGVGAGAAFAGLGLALLLLIPSVIIFSKMDTHTLVKGGAAVFVFMQMIARSAKAAGEAKGAFGAFLGISLALLLLIPSIKLLSNMDAKTLIKGGAAVAALMYMLSNAAKRANGGAKGFFGMAIAIGVITGAMYVLSGLSWTDLIASSHALSVVLGAIAEALSKIGGMEFGQILKAVAGLAMALVVVGGALWLLTEFGDGKEQLTAALGISAILLAFSFMGPTIETLSKIPFQAGVVAAGNAMVFFGAMVLCLGALGEISQLGGGKAGDAIVEGCTLIGRAISGFLDGFVGDTFNGVGEMVSSIGEHLSSFGQSIGGFIDGLSNVDEQTVTNAKNLALAILAICGADLLDALTGWLRGSHDLGSFSESFEPLTNAVIAMNDALANETLDSEKIGQMADVVTRMTELADAVPKTGGKLQVLTGVKDLSAFATDMNEFIGEGGFTDFMASVDSLNISPTVLAKMFMIKSSTSAMIDLANSLPKSGFISTFIDGTADLGEFATSMAAFLAYDKYGLFVTRVDLVGEADLGKLRGNVIPATQEMINLASKIKSNTSIIDAITGRTNLGKFGETLADFGGGIVKFSDSIANVSTIKMVGITGVLFSLADLNASDKVKGNGMSSFGLSINSLGKSLSSFIKDTQDVTSERLADISGGMANLHNMLLIIAASDYSGVDNFAEAMKKLAETSVTEFVEGFASNTEAATVAIQGFTAAVTEALTGDPEAIKEKARSIITTFSSEIYAPSGNLMMQASGEHLVNALIEGVNNVKDEDLETSAKSIITTFSAEIYAPAGNAMMKASGEHMITAIVAGVTSMLSEITKAAIMVVAMYGAGIASRRLALSGYGKLIVNAAYSGAKDKNEDFYDLGQDAADGYARGIRSKAQEAADEAREMVSKAIKAAQDEQKSASPSKIYRGLGQDGGEGYALGFGDMVSMVVTSVRDMGHAGIFAMQDTISHIKDSVDSGIEFNPVITPVLDLSQMTSGVISANAMLSSMQLNGLAATAAITIANQHNAALAQAKAVEPIDYTKYLSSLIENTRNTTNAVRENRYAIIDGDSAFDYFDRRLGMA